MCILSEISLLPTPRALGCTDVPLPVVKFVLPETPSCFVFGGGLWAQSQRRSWLGPQRRRQESTAVRGGRVGTKFLQKWTGDRRRWLRVVGTYVLLPAGVGGGEGWQHIKREEDPSYLCAKQQQRPSNPSVWSALSYSDTRACEDFDSGTCLLTGVEWWLSSPWGFRIPVVFRAFVELI